MAMPVVGTAELRGLAQIFADVDLWSRNAETLPIPAPEAGSALAGDNEKLGVYPGTHLVGACLHGVLDHLDAFRQLIVKAQALHAAAPVTLLRAALEEGTLGLWLISPNPAQGAGAPRPERPSS
jgi:hypothetical protein